MRRARGIFGAAVLTALISCSVGAPKPPGDGVSASGGAGAAATSAASQSSTAGPPTPLEGKWRAVVMVHTLRHLGFTAAQIRADQRHEGWSSRYAVGLTVIGDTWVLTEQPDEAATILGAHGPLSVSDGRVRLTDATPPACLEVFTFRVHDHEMSMQWIRGNCGESPIDPVPDFMYAAIFEQTFHEVR
jgi:hypothetical protein